MLHLFHVILHVFEEDECEKVLDTRVMNCDTLFLGRALFIDIVSLKGKNEICEQNYAAHPWYYTKVRRMSYQKLLILRQNGSILHQMLIGPKLIVVVLERVKHNTLLFSLMLVIIQSIENFLRKKIDVILWRNKMGGRLPRVYDRKTSMKKKVVVLTA